MALGSALCGTSGGGLTYHLDLLVDFRWDLTGICCDLLGFVGICLNLLILSDSGVEIAECCQVLPIW